jgi:hypothetical protein
MKHGNMFKLALAAVVCFSVFSLAQIPTIRVTTLNNATPQSQNGGNCGGSSNPWDITGQTYNFPYVNVTKFELSDPNNAQNNFTRTSKPDSIRLRGNSTSTAAKKPYRIKFGEKTSLFGKEAAKSWVLLANFYDATFALNAIAFELGERMGLEFTPTSQLVNLYINNSYMGIYQLTEQVQSNPGRVDIREKNGGWLVEFDYHKPASDECLSYFTTGSSRYDLTTFIKSPELDEMDNPNDSTQLRFVKTDLFALVNKMAESGFPNNGYRDLIDLESFAKYVLIQMLMDNFDFNSKTQTGGLPGSNFAYRIDNKSKIKAGPLWDFDLSAGVTTANFPRHYSTYQDQITPRHEFYLRLWSDDVFKAKFKKTWDNYQDDFNAIPAFIDNITSSLSGSIQGNTWANNSMGGSGALTTQTFNTEVQNLKTWWNNRLTFFGQEINKLNIDTSKDTETTPSSNSGNSSSSSAASNCASISTDRVFAATTNACFSYECNGTFEMTSNSTAKTASVSGGCSKSNFTIPANQWVTICNSTGMLQITAGTNWNNVRVRCNGNTPIALRQITTSNGLSAIKNGVNLHVQTTARLDVYSLSGKREKTMNLNGGVYNIQFSDLPKGMYIIRATFGSERKTLRISVM